MTQRVWVLGAPDPEMMLIEGLLRGSGEKILYAADESGRRVHPGNAYRCPIPGIPPGPTVYAVECIDVLPEGWVRIDHHRPGDPGYGRPPEEFMPASSIGQVLSILRDHLPPTFDAGEWITSDGIMPRHPTGYLIGMPFSDSVPHEFVLAAAADHCLAAAYRGECPGVDPDDLMRWRAETRATFQGRSVEELLTDVERAREALRAAPLVELSEPLACEYHGATYEPGCGACAHSVVYDLRGGSVPELPEAAAREGVAYLAIVPDRDGRRKVVLGGHTTPDTVRAFLDDWAPTQGLADIYGDPARGFAGGYTTRPDVERASA